MNAKDELDEKLDLNANEISLVNTIKAFTKKYRYNDNFNKLGLSVHFVELYVVYHGMKKKRKNKMMHHQKLIIMTMKLNKIMKFKVNYHYVLNAIQIIVFQIIWYPKILNN